MGWSDPDSFLTRLFSGDPLAILISFIVTLTLPTLLHWYFYTTSPQATLTPTFLLLGPSGSGKTSLISLLQQRNGNQDAESSPTRVSQTTLTANLSLPISVPLGSNKYRSVNDHELNDVSRKPMKYIMTDTPGHGKLRSEQAISQLSNPAVRGAIFMVDSAALDSSDADAIRDTATYLHDVLLAIQRRKTGKVKVKTEIRVLIAANKQDLFTALPAGAIRDRIQTEVERVRKSRTRGITTVDANPDAEDDDDVLGGGGEEPFSFKLIEAEYGIVVDVIGGAVKGEEAGKGVQKWEEWIGSCL